MAVEDYIFSNTPEDQDKLHPSLKKMYETGLENDSDFYTSLNRDNANSFYKLDLNNMNPEEYDSEILNRNRSWKSDFKYGWFGSAASGAELLSSIPGGIDRLYDWGRSALGYEPTPDSIFDKTHEYLDDIAQGFTPEARGIAAPTTFGGKVIAGFAAAPLTIAQYVPAVRIAKSLTIGTAATEFLRSIDDGNLTDIAKATAMGGGMGFVIGLATRARLPLRMASLAAIGFGSAGWKASMEDRWAAAVVWGSLGILPTRRMDSKGILAKPETAEMSALKKLNENTDLKPFDNVYNKLVNTKKEIDQARTLLEEKIAQLEASVAPQEKALYAIKDVSKKLIGADHRTVDQIRIQLRKIDDTPAYKDMETKIGEKASVFLKPGKFQDHPLMKWVVDKTNLVMKASEAYTDWML